MAYTDPFDGLPRRNLYASRAPTATKVSSAMSKAVTVIPNPGAVPEMLAQEVTKPPQDVTLITPDVTKPVTKPASVTKVTGRPAKSGVAMTAAERKRLSRAKKAKE